MFLLQSEIYKYRTWLPINIYINIFDKPIYISMNVEIYWNLNQYLQMQFCITELHSLIEASGQYVLATVPILFTVSCVSSGAAIDGDDSSVEEIFTLI